MKYNFILNDKPFNIHPVCARDMLNSLLDAEQIKKPYDKLSNEKLRLIDIAAIASKALFEGEAAAFGSIEDVLDSLSDKQLLEFYNAYQTVENEANGMLIKTDFAKKPSPNITSKTVYKNNIFYSVREAVPTFSLNELAEILQIESLRRFRNTGGDLIDR